jgi:hypothetical protein
MLQELLKKADLDRSVSKEAFAADVDCLFSVLRDSYGLYGYFGHEAFENAHHSVMDVLNGEPFDFDRGTAVLRDALSAFIRDGHFRIGQRTATAADPGFAVEHTMLFGIPTIRCRQKYRCRGRFSG